MNKNSYWWNIDEKLSPIGEQLPPKKSDFVVVGQYFQITSREAILEVHTIDNGYTEAFQQALL